MALTTVLRSLRNISKFLTAPAPAPAAGGASGVKMSKMGATTITPAAFATEFPGIAAHCAGETTQARIPVVLASIGSNTEDIE